MSIILFTGKPGNGKSCKMADVALDLLARNWRWFVKTGEKRLVATNLNLAKWVHEKYPGMVLKWSDVIEVVRLTGADILWDEVANQLDAVQWQSLPLEVKTFLREHEKRGCDIYATTQNFPSVDVSFRRLITELYECKKLFGSPRPGPCKPPVRRVWGLIILDRYEVENYEVAPRREGGFPGFLWISRDLVSAYDTLQSIKLGQFPPLKHVERKCETCQAVKILHT